MASDSLDISFQAPQTHRVRFTDDVLGQDQQILADLLQPSGDQPARVQFWVDSNVAQAHPDLKSRLRTLVARHGHLEMAGSIQTAPGGEDIKNDIHVLERMLKVFNVANLDRRSYVVVIGGGAVLDTVGFAAAIAHRGIRLVRLPTTTLGQGDSGVGVKNGVNLFQKKNWLGAFACPWGVVNDQHLLSTLSDRDYISGFSECVKVALLKSPELFETLCRDAEHIRGRASEAASPVLRESALLHLRHITEGGDPFENLEARPLDFGHWSAHRLESMTEFAMRHGEAVALGVALDVVYSSMKFGFPREQANRVLKCLANLGFDLQDDHLLRFDELHQGLEEFRQHLGGRLTVTMLEDVGRPRDVHEVDWPAMRDALQAVHRGGVPV